MLAANPTLFHRIIDEANRANPYPLLARLREKPVARQPDGSIVVSGYDAVARLLFDPRLSADAWKLAEAAGRPTGESSIPGEPPFLVLDPPKHDRMRELAMKHFGPPRHPGRVEAMRGRIESIVADLLDAQSGGSEIDVVGQFAYPLPVTVICDLLGVPREDETRFRVWSEILAGTLDPDPTLVSDDYFRTVSEAATELQGYMRDLIHHRRRHPGDDLLSAMVNDTDPGAPMPEDDLVTTSVLMLIAGHETTANLIANGVLAMLRRPELHAALLRRPEAVAGFVDEALRFDPPVQFRPRAAVADIEIGGETIPAGSLVMLVFASANRDPARFADPDRFDIDRPDNRHFGFGGGIHFCFGAPLARLEAQVAFSAFVRRVRDPRLVLDPPPYKANPALRGPASLPVAFGEIVP